MSLPSYAEYKDSGIEWIGNVPTHWAVEPIKRGFAVVGGSTPKSDEATYWDGEIVWVSPADLSRLPSMYIEDSIRKISDLGLNSCGAALVPPGSIVLSTRAPIGSLAIAKVTLCTNQGCKSLVPHRTASSLYFAYVLLSATTPLNLRGKGTTFLELSADELACFKVPFPPQAEQTAIASFVDRETAKIDALIAEQEKLIALLAEKRQATISHAVTRGLNPNAPMKDSGVAWIGKVPAHWEIIRIKWVVASIEQGWSPQCENFPISEPDEWGVLKVGCVNGGEFKPSENKKLPPELAPIPAYSLKRDDLLISRANTRELVGSAAVVDADFNQLMLCDKLYRLRLTKECMSSYLAAYLGTPQARSQIELEATGASSSMLNIGQSAILELFTPLPKVTEQREILRFLSAEKSRLNGLHIEAQNAINLLKERRSALIAAAVTGQIDVRQLYS